MRCMLLTGIPILYFIFEFVRSDLSVPEVAILALSGIFEYALVIIMNVGIFDIKMLYMMIGAIAVQTVVILQYWIRTAIILFLTRNKSDTPNYSSDWKIKLEEKTNEKTY